MLYPCVLRSTAFTWNWTLAGGWHCAHYWNCHVHKLTCLSCLHRSYNCGLTWLTGLRCSLRWSSVFQITHCSCSCIFWSSFNSALSGLKEKKMAECFVFGPNIQTYTAFNLLSYSYSSVCTVIINQCFLCSWLAENIILYFNICAAGLKSKCIFKKWPLHLLHLEEGVNIRSHGVLSICRLMNWRHWWIFYKSPTQPSQPHRLILSCLFDLWWDLNRTWSDGTFYHMTPTFSLLQCLAGTRGRNHSGSKRKNDGKDLVLIGHEGNCVISYKFYTKQISSLHHHEGVLRRSFPFASFYLLRHKDYPTVLHRPLSQHSLFDSHSSLISFLYEIHYSLLPFHTPLIQPCTAPLSAFLSFSHFLSFFCSLFFPLCALVVI